MKCATFTLLRKIVKHNNIDISKPKKIISIDDVIYLRV